MSVVVPLVAALIGSLVGGGLALFAGYRNDLRSERRGRTERIQELAADLLAESNAMSDYAGEIQSRASSDTFDPNDEQHRQDMRALKAALTAANRALDHLSWLVYFSPLYAKVSSLETLGSSVVGNWSATREDWVPEAQRFAKKLEDLHHAINWFTQQPPTVRVEYLRSESRLLPPGVGVRPTSWPGLLTRRHRLQFWRRNFFRAY